jgi:hypothetical protein
MRRFLPIAFILLAMASSAAEKELRLPVGREVFTLSAFGEVAPRRHYFGEYRFPIEYTGGTKLHLFPNGRFVISEWSDIGPDELQAAGSYQVRADRLTLKFSQIRRGHEELRRRFSDLHLLWGWIQKKDYVTGFEVFVFPSEGWQTLKTNPEKADYLQRRTEYNDWERILRDYEAPRK